MNIQKRKLTDLKPATYNPRKKLKPGDYEFEAIENSITAFGYVDPIIINSDNTVIGGHQRLTVLKHLGHVEEIDVVVVDLPKSEEKALNIALNKISGSWDAEALEDLLKDIESTTPELLALTGFNLDELDEILNSINNDDIIEDEIPDVVEPICKLGDLWQLGNHRLLCGDATKIEDIEKLMDGKKVDMVFIDPPYSVNYTKKTKEIFKTDNYSEIMNDNLSVSETSEKIWFPAFFNLYNISKDDSSIYLTMPQGGDQMMMMMMMMMMMKSGWQVKHELIWVKDNAVFSMNRLDYDYQHEPILYGWKKKHNFYGNGKYKKSVWNISRKENKLHPTMKPIELISNCLLNSTKNNNLIVDVFGGSGSTLIACEQTNRNCYMMELDEHYCDVIITRWENLTGKKAVKL